MPKVRQRRTQAPKRGATQRRENPIRHEMPLSDQKPPLNLNQRGHWAKTSPTKARLRKEAATKATQMQIPKSNHITTRLHYVAPDKRRRDSDNIIATAKPLWDGLVDAKIVPDDTPEHMTKIMPKIHPPDNSGPRMWLEIIVSERPK